VVFVQIESRVAAPVVPLALFRDRTALTVLASGFAVNTAWYGIVFMIGLYVQQIRGASALAAGLMFIPMAAGIMITNVASPRVAALTGARVPLVTGMLVTAAAPVGLLWAGPVWQTALLLVPLGVVGLSIPTLITVLLEHMSASQAGLAGGVFNASRQVGSAVGVALFGALAGDGSSFRSGMTASLVIGSVLFAAAAAANALTFAPRAAITGAKS
jgi:DHA2 family methylenomycin A resistance protein-like MFS transporter